jgi:hypothetical protein
MQHGEDLYIVRSVEARHGRSVEAPVGDRWWWFCELEALQELKEHIDGCECGFCGYDLLELEEGDDPEDFDDFWEPHDGYYDH